MEKLENIVNELQEVRGATTEILRDTIGDYKKVNFRQTITIWILILTLFAGSIFSMWSISRRAAEYEQRFIDFLSQYEFETIIEGTQDGEGINIMGNGNSASPK